MFWILFASYIIVGAFGYFRGKAAGYEKAVDGILEITKNTLDICCTDESEKEDDCK